MTSLAPARRARPRWTTAAGYGRSLRLPLVVAAAALALAGCSTQARPAQGAEDARDFGAIDACEAILDGVRHALRHERDEAVLQAMLEQAVEAYPSCLVRYEAAARTPGEVVLFRHRAHHMELYALLLESELSARFDGGAHRCSILQDTFRNLIVGLRRIEEALEVTPLSEEERRRLVELRHLDLQALDVLFLDFEATCSQDPAGLVQ